MKMIYATAKTNERRHQRIHALIAQQPSLAPLDLSANFGIPFFRTYLNCGQPGGGHSRNLTTLRPPIDVG